MAVPDITGRARDIRILDIFEGTQQTEQLVIARRPLGRSSTELR